MSQSEEDGESVAEIEPEEEEEQQQTYIVNKSGKGFTIPHDVEELGYEEVEKLIEEYGLDTESPKITLYGNDDDDNNINNNNNNNASIDRYMTVWNSFRNFCFLIQDYSSAMLVCRNVCPGTNPFPIHLDTIIMFLTFRIKKEGTVLKHPKTNEIVKDINGYNIHCLGDFRGKSSVGMVRSSISKLAKLYDTTKGEYLDPCIKCQQVSNDVKKRGKGCRRRHYHEPRPFGRGNAVLDVQFTEHINMMEKYVGLHYQPRRHTFAFLPSTLRDIRDHLLTYNKKYQLMIWTIMICGIRLFQEIEEVIGMTVERFATDYFVITDDEVKGLCYELKARTRGGGNNNQELLEKFILWNYEDCPEFSACKAILIWISISGIQSGYLFPSKAVLEDEESEGLHPTEHIEYRVLLHEIKKLCTGVGGMNNDVVENHNNNKGGTSNSPQIFGTNMLRKTGFLMAYWGNAYHQQHQQQGNNNTNDNNNMFHELQQASILFDARHKDIGSTASYLEDSGTIRALLDNIDPNNPRHYVGIYQPIHITNLHSYFTTLNQQQSLRQPKPLPELAEWYVHDILKIPRSYHYLTIADICRIACGGGYTPKPNTNTNLKQELLKEMSEERADVIMRLIDKKANEHARDALLCARAVVAGGGVFELPTTEANEEEEGENNDDNAQEQRPEKRFRLDSVELEHCADYRTKARTYRNDRQQQCILFIEVCQEIKAQVAAGKILRDPLKSWAYKRGAVVDCIETCYDGNMEEFLAENKVALSRFGICAKNQKHTAKFF